MLIENLDRVLKAIGSDGQRGLRALLENHRPLLLLATSTRPRRRVPRSSRTVLRLLRHHHLEPFDVEQAAEMLKRIAKLNGDDDLAARLDDR